jgi:hypothetical protein
MARLNSFFLGLLAGAALTYFALGYHVLRTKDGFEVIRKTTPTFAQSYVDVRTFDGGAWTERPELAAAVMKAGKEELLGDAALESLRAGFNQLFAPAERR